MSVKVLNDPMDLGPVAERGWGKRWGPFGHIHLGGAALKRILTGWPGWTLLGLLPILIGAVYQATAAANELRKYTAPGKRVDIGGRRLHLRAMGEGSPTVILEATGFGCSVDYASIQSEIAEMTRVCAYDRAGMGWSDPYHAPRSVQALVDDLRTLLQRGEIPPPYLLVGGSAGGLIVELFARTYPEEVVGLVLIDALDEEALAWLPRASTHLVKMVSLGQVCARLGVLSLLDPFGLKKLPLEEGGVRSALTYRAAAWDAARLFLRTLQKSETDLRAAPPLRPDLPVTVLTHGMVGDLLGPRAHPELLREIEPIWQEQQAALARRSSRGRQIIAEKSGHRIIAQQPELVVEAIRDILSEFRKE
ncbi:MAG: alpha/beta hydrolase [Candidatus Manganitrophaceae bacterium]|nr:MAG: alpha/beta hydrolase [Candidatus Manganitrophaceae bacterium]